MQQLQESGSTVLNANGSGRVYLGPTVVRQSWQPTQATASAPTIAAGTVLNSNPTFESGITGWSTTAATLTQSAAFAHTGTKSGLITSTAGSDPRAEAEQVNVNPNYVYRYDGWLYTATALGFNVGIQVNWFTSVGGYISTTGPYLTNPVGAWTNYAADVTPPPTAARGQIRYAITGSPGAGKLLYGDDIEFTQVTPSLEAECTLYLSVGPTIGTKLGTTRTGSTGDTFGFGGLTIPPGLGVLAVWDGGEPGVTATLGIFGTKGRFAS